MRKLKLVAAAILATISGTAVAQDRKASPYIACGADVAQQQATSNKSIGAIQKIALSKCAPLLEQNVSNSLAAMEREKGPVPAQMREHVKQTLRNRLKSGLPYLIQMNVTALRQAR